MSNLEYKVINAVLKQKDMNVLMTPNTDDIFTICPDIWQSIKNYVAKYRAMPSFDIIRERFTDLEDLDVTGVAQHYMDELRDTYIRNRLSDIMIMQNRALKERAGPDVLLALQGKLSELSRYTNAAREVDIMDFPEAERHYMEVQKRAAEMGGMPGISTRLAFWDSAYPTGLGAGDLVVIFGWAQPHSEPILTPNGWSTMGDVQVGDYVIGSDGKPTKILNTYERGVRDIYKVEFNDGSFVFCDKDHLWAVQTNKTRQNGRAYQPVSTEEISKKVLYSNHRESNYKYFVPLPEPIMGTKLATQVGPYLMGQLLSDGCTVGASIILTTNDEEAVDIARLENPEIEIVERTGETSTARQWLVRGGYKKLGLIKGLYSYQKYIPEEYMLALPEERLALLRGLMDGDGSCRPRERAYFYTTSERLAEDVAELVRSLGGTPRIRTDVRENRRSGYVVSIWLKENVFAIQRKANRYTPTRDGFKAIVSVTKMDAMEPMKCIRVEAGDSLYVTRNYTLTHNTNHGKSSLAALVACNAYLSHFKPMYISLEMSPEKVRDRMYTILGGGVFENSKLSIGDINIDDFRTWSNKHSDKGEFIVMSGNGVNEVTPNYIHAKIEEHRPGLVVLDYAQLASDNAVSGDMTHRMRNMSQECKQVAVANDIPFVVISSATPDNATAADAPPRLEQVAWSKQLAYDADLAVAMHKRSATIYEAVGRKNRNGPLFDGILEWDINTGVWRERPDLA